MPDFLILNCVFSSPRLSRASYLVCTCVSVRGGWRRPDDQAVGGGSLCNEQG